MYDILENDNYACTFSHYYSSSEFSIEGAYIRKAMTKYIMVCAASIKKSSAVDIVCFFESSHSNQVLKTN